MNTNIDDIKCAHQNKQDKEHFCLRLLNQYCQIFDENIKKKLPEQNQRLLELQNKSQKLQQLQYFLKFPYTCYQIYRSYEKNLDSSSLKKLKFDTKIDEQISLNNQKMKQTHKQIIESFNQIIKNSKYNILHQMVKATLLKNSVKACFKKEAYQKIIDYLNHNQRENIYHKLNNLKYIIQYFGFDINSNKIVPAPHKIYHQSTIRSHIRITLYEYHTLKLSTQLVISIFKQMKFFKIFTSKKQSKTSNIHTRNNNFSNKISNDGKQSSSDFSRFDKLIGFYLILSFKDLEGTKNLLEDAQRQLAKYTLDKYKNCNSNHKLNQSILKEIQIKIRKKVQILVRLLKIIHQRNSQELKKTCFEIVDYVYKNEKGSNPARKSVSKSNLCDLITKKTEDNPYFFK